MVIVPVINEIVDEATDEHLVVISDIVVIDATVDSAAGLNPTENTLVNEQVTIPSNNGGSGGALGWLSLFVFAGLAIRFRSIFH